MSLPSDDSAVATSGEAAERSISPVSGQLRARMTGRAMALAGLVAGCGVFVLATWGTERGRTSDAQRPVQPVRQVVPFEPIRPDRPTLARPGPDAPSLSGQDGTAMGIPALEASRSPSGAGRALVAGAPTDAAVAPEAPLLAFSRTMPAPQRLTEQPGPRDGPLRPVTELDQLRQGSTIGQARATRLGDRNFMILAGSAIPCVLQTAMDTATPGYVSCLAPRDVLSDNGAVVLMEKGTRVMGEYRSSMQQGQDRLFVLWTRAVTPSGVSIALGSPAADGLGRAGFDGAVNTHFWDRFGAAVLLSVLDDGAYAVAGRAGDGLVRAPSDAAAVALQGSINIPPSLRKAQGSEVSIFVAQDLDFSGVYGLRTIEP